MPLPPPRPLRAPLPILLLGLVLLPAMLWWLRGHVVQGFYLADDFMFLRAGAMGAGLPLLDAIWLCVWPEALLEGTPKQYWRPAHNLLLLGQQLAFGLDPAPRHAIQLAMLALAGAGLGLWVRALGARPFTALVAALLFVAHPAQGELASWLAAQDILVAITGTLLGQGALATALRRYRRHRRHRLWLSLAILCQWLGIMGHELGIVGVPLWCLTVWTLSSAHRGGFRWLMRWCLPAILMFSAWALVRSALFGWSQMFDFWNEEMGVAGAFRPDRSIWYRLGALRGILLPVHWGIPGAVAAIPAAILLLAVAVRGGRGWRFPGLRPRLLLLGSMLLAGIALVLYVPNQPDTLLGARTAGILVAGISAAAAFGLGRLVPIPRPRALRFLVHGGGVVALLAASALAVRHNDSGYARAQTQSRALHEGVRLALHETAPGGKVFIADIPRVLAGAVFRLAPFGQDSIEFGPPLLPKQQGPRLRRTRPGQDREFLAAMVAFRKGRDRAMRFDPIQGLIPLQPGEHGVQVPGGVLRIRMAQAAVVQGTRGPIPVRAHFEPAPTSAGNPGMNRWRGGTLRLVAAEGAGRFPELTLPNAPDGLGEWAPDLGNLSGREAPGRWRLMFAQKGEEPIEIGSLEILPAG